ncbi:TPA: YhjR family protein, partial [Proteus mirabilis]|nr:YhjR family protein [Proteus mirabilis]
IKREKESTNQDINKLKKLFSINNYHYRDINNEENQHSLIYRWPLLNTFNSITK